MYTECAVWSDNICGGAFQFREDGRNIERTGNAHDTVRCCKNLSEGENADDSDTGENGEIKENPDGNSAGQEMSRVM